MLWTTMCHAKKIGKLDNCWCWNVCQFCDLCWIIFVSTAVDWCIVGIWDKRWTWVDELACLFFFLHSCIPLRVTLIKDLLILCLAEQLISSALPSCMLSDYHCWKCWTLRSQVSTNLFGTKGFVIVVRWPLPRDDRGRERSGGGRERERERCYMFFSFMRWELGVMCAWFERGTNRFPNLTELAV